MTFLQTDLEQPHAGIDDPGPVSRVPPAAGEVPGGGVVVEFAGARGGVAPLTWGQASIWRLTTWRAAG
ncbi:hypothetical protein ACSDR0_32580, partial [Streptosporangium sp. G11]|uniref:hypothetical protein n=1 Tax=Streptosporangium sp. G11 TaxID=3436926 RepID=UPI003EB9979B